MKYRWRKTETKGAVMSNVRELQNWAKEKSWPEEADKLEDLQDDVMYVVPLDWSKYPSTEGVVLVCKKGISWMLQMISSGMNYALHIDGKHKVHHGKWILLNAGIHSIEHDGSKVTHTFRPTAHLFSKQHESAESIEMLMDGIKLTLHTFAGFDFFKAGVGTSMYADIYSII